MLDSSAATDLLLGLDAAPWVEQQLTAVRSVHAPHVLDVEVVSALRGLVRARMITARRAAEGVVDLGDLPVTRYPHRPLLERIWSLRGTLTAYDAAFVALSEAIGATLVTTDGGQARAAARFIAVESFAG